MIHAKDIPCPSFFQQSDDQLSDYTETHHDNVTAKRYIRVQYSVVSCVEICIKHPDLFVRQVTEQDDIFGVHNCVPPMRGVCENQVTRFEHAHSLADHPDPAHHG